MLCSSGTCVFGKCLASARKNTSLFNSSSRHKGTSQLDIRQLLCLCFVPGLCMLASLGHLLTLPQKWKTDQQWSWCPKLRDVCTSSGACQDCTLLLHVRPQVLLHEHYPGDSWVRSHSEWQCWQCQWHDSRWKPPGEVLALACSYQCNPQSPNAHLSIISFDLMKKFSAD